MNTNTPKIKLRLGLFIVGGITLFVLAIFIIGKQKNLFNPVFYLTSTFSNVSGLQVGNNIRFSGINVGTVDNITIINDTAVRVDLMIRKDVWQFIKSDSKVVLGSEGIIGDKIITILPGRTDAPLAKDGQLLKTVETIETNVIMARLDATTANAENISKQLSEITDNINGGTGTLSRLILDKKLAEDFTNTISNLNLFSQGLKGSDVVMTNLKAMAVNADYISHQLAEITNKINKGDGTLGRLIQDSTIAENLNQSILNLKKTSEGLTGTDTMMSRLNGTALNAEILTKQLTEMMKKINTGNGTLGRLIRDTTFAENLNQTMINLKSSSKGLDENMNAAKQNFLFRRYFEKKAKVAAEKKEALEKAALEKAALEKEALEELRNSGNKE